MEANQRLTILIIAAALMGAAMSIRELVHERAIFRREYAVGLSPGGVLREQGAGLRRRLLPAGYARGPAGDVGPARTDGHGVLRQGMVGDRSPARAVRCGHVLRRPVDLGQGPLDRTDDSWLVADRHDPRSPCAARSSRLPDGRDRTGHDVRPRPMGFAATASSTHLDRSSRFIDDTADQLHVRPVLAEPGRLDDPRHPRVVGRIRGSAPIT